MLSATKSRITGKPFPLTLIFFFLISQICSAQWFWQNPLPQGNGLQSVKFISADVGWAVGAGGTIIKTTNRGITWTIQSNETGYTLYSVSFADANNGCAVGEKVIYNDSLLTLISLGIILHTTNGGTNWTSQTIGSNLKLYGVSFTDANNGWVVGVEWDTVSGIKGLIRHTSNGGTTWTKQTSGTTAVLYDISFIDANNGWAVGYDNTNPSGEILKTTNGGTTWISQLQFSGGLRAVCFTDVNNGWAIGGDAAEHSIILKTTDGGTNWTSQILGTVLWSLEDLSFTDVNNGWVVGNRWLGLPYDYFIGIIFRTTNGGTTWTTQRSGIKGELFLGVSSSDANNGTVVGGGDGQFSLGTIILRTTNGGTNWNSQTSGTTTTSFQDVFFADANTGWAVGGDELNKLGVILSTTNGGTTWTEQNGVGGVALFFFDVNNGWVLGDYIYHTTNGGTTWTSQTVTADYLYDIAFSDENNGWIIGIPNYRTTDGGKTWNEQYGTAGGLAIYFTDANNGWVVGSQGKIFRTTNGGTTWTEQTSGTTENLFGVHFTDANNGWAVGTEHVDSLYTYYGLILHTINGGTTWSKQTIEGTRESLYDVYFIDANNGWIGGGGGAGIYHGLIMHTTDGGINWSRQTNGTTSALWSIYFMDESNGWAVGERGTILHTSNGGVTFFEEEQIDEVPTEYNLSNNFPNPFNPSTKIKYSIPQSSQVVIKVFDILGIEIETLVNEEKTVGTYEINWNAANLPSGVYFYQLRAGDFIHTKKMILLK